MRPLSDGSLNTCKTNPIRPGGPVTTAPPFHSPPKGQSADCGGLFHWRREMLISLLITLLIVGVIIGASVQ